MTLRLRDRLRRRPGRLTWEMLECTIADAVMINLALLTAFALRFLSFFVLGVGQEGATLQTYSSPSSILHTSILQPPSSILHSPFFTIHSPSSIFHLPFDRISA